MSKRSTTSIPSVSIDTESLPEATSSAGEPAPQASATRADDALVPLLNRGAALKLITDPSIGKSTTVIVHPGINYLRRADLFALGSIAIVVDRSTFPPTGIPTWRVFPTNPPAVSGVLEVLDPTAQALPKALEIVKASTHAPSLRMLAEGDSRPQVVAAATARAGLVAGR